MDHTLDYWYKYFEDFLVTGKIAREHITQLGFSYMPVDFVIGADHGQDSFCAGVKSSSIMQMVVFSYLWAWGNIIRNGY
jgi:hypothetical protein